MNICIHINVRVRRCNIFARALLMLLSCSLHSDGEEMSTADNFNDIYYSLKYEGDLLFTRFVNS